MLILNYHGIEKFAGEYPWQPGEKRYTVSTSQFESQLTLIREKNVVSLNLASLKDELGMALVPQRVIPAQAGIQQTEASLDSRFRGNDRKTNSVVLTFDDGHISHLFHAAPVLKRHGLTGIFFITAGFLGQKNYLSKDQVKELIGMGFEIGSHGFNHVPLTGLPMDQLVHEIAGSKHALEKELGIRIRAFSVPRGFYVPAIRQIARQCGYDFVFTSFYGLNRPGASDTLKLKRVAILPEMSAAEFAAILDGRLGFRGISERIKSQVRNYVPAAAYDWLAAVKGKIRS